VYQGRTGDKVKLEVSEEKRASKVTFLVQSFLLIENHELAVLVGILQHAFALVDVTTVVLQPQQWCHQRIIRLPATNQQAFTDTLCWFFQYDTETV